MPHSHDHKVQSLSSYFFSLQAIFAAGGLFKVIAPLC